MTDLAQLGFSNYRGLPLANVIAELIVMITEVLGEQPLIPIDRHTSFDDDLEFESIELVSLAEKIQSRYGEQINFIDWLSQKDLDEIIKLRVGDLVDFIEQSLSSQAED